MKKFFLYALAIVTVAGMISSCDKDKKPSGGGGGGGQDVAELITIDGDFADWDAATAASSFELEAEAPYAEGLIAMKAIADDSNIYIYFEYVLAEEQGDSAPFEIFIDADNNVLKGGASWLWDPIGYEYMLEDETGFYAAGAVRDMSESMNIYNYDGVDGADAWGEGGHLTQLEVSAFCESAGKVAGDVVKVEVSVLRSVVNCLKAGKCGVGLCAYTSGWATSGLLPQGEGAGTEPLLEVVLP